jgi:hypothetical protein
VGKELRCYQNMLGALMLLLLLLLPEDDVSSALEA